MTETITIIIDGQDYQVPRGMNLVDAAKMHGIDIPVFCYHPKLDPAGMCRMCLVELGTLAINRETGEPERDKAGQPVVRWFPKLQTACTQTVSPGMVVRTDSAAVAQARDDVLEFLLTSHPLDCPICDKGGECPLQNLTMAYGPGTSAFIYDDKIHLAKHVPLGELIYLDRERCIQCARCTRFCDEIVGDDVLAFHERGRRLQIITVSDPPFDTKFSGNTTDICPVGALTTADFRFGARPWELDEVPSICPHCPVGCNISASTRLDRDFGGRKMIKRIMPRQNEIWICDKGRWAHHFAEDAARLVDPLVRKNGELVKATWEEALALAAQHLSSAGAALVTLAGGRLANEDLFTLRKLTEALGGRPVLHSYMAGGDWTARIGLPPGSDIRKMGTETAILVVASDLEEEAPIWYLRVRAAAKRGARLIVMNPRPTKLDRLATHVVHYAYGEEGATVRAFLASETAGDAIKVAAQEFAAAENAVVFFGSEGLGLDGSRDLAEACAGLLFQTNHTGRINNGLVGVWPKANLQGAWDMGFTPVDNLADLLTSADTVYIVAADPAGDDPALARALSESQFVIVQELFFSETAKLADVVFPAQSFVEREGTFTSGERRVQRFYQAALPLRGPRADFRIAADLGRQLGKEIEGRDAALIMTQIARQIPGYTGVTYSGLAEVHDQWPIVHRNDLYYGGTTYQNSQGLGIQLQPQGIDGGWQVGLSQAGAMARAECQPGEILLVPVTRLYDQGATVAPSHLLHARLAQAEARLHPITAARFQLADGDKVVFTLEDKEWILLVKLDGTAPEGVALTTRSTGIPVSAPRAVELQRLAQAGAAHGTVTPEPTRSTR